jgi:hypothetical protein
MIPAATAMTTHTVTSAGPSRGSELLTFRESCGLVGDAEKPLTSGAAASGWTVPACASRQVVARSDSS